MQAQRPEMMAKGGRSASEVLRGALCTLALFSLLFSGSATAAPAASASVPSRASVASPTDSITVEASRHRALIRHQISHYVSAITLPPFDESLARWQARICPLVAGLPKDQGEYVLARFSQVARAAGAPLDTPDCRYPNLLVIVTHRPRQLLKRIWRRFPQAFNEDRGIEPIKRFVNTERPIRVWYNLQSRCPAFGADLPRDSPPDLMSDAICSSVGTATRLRWGDGFAVRMLSSVFVVIDARSLQGLDIGQLTDYISMIGLAQIRENSDPGDVPTILHLFAGTGAGRPQALSRWDQDFLHALYHTDAGSVMLLSEIKLRMSRDLAP